jgi:hypothetical protein
MGIDGIGKSGPPLPPPPVPEAGAASHAAPTGRTFQVQDATPAPTAQPVAPGAPPRALDRLCAGEVDVQGYVDLKVDEATAHLSALPPIELDAIRTALREQMTEDPVFAELVRTAAGETSPPLDD